MPITRSTGVLVGTDDTTGETVAAKATLNGSEIDVLGDNTSYGVINLFLSFTVPASRYITGKIKVSVEDGRISGQLYTDPDKQWSFRLHEAQGTRCYVSVGRIHVSRFMKAIIQNFSSVELTNVSLLYTLEKTS
jgi:hypothetical protein